MTKTELQKAQKHLSKDLIMQKLIQEHDQPKHSLSQNLFYDLIDSITSQQLSVKAAATIFKRFLDLFPDSKPLPELILLKSDDELRSVGLSFQKIKYIKGISEAVQSNQINLNNLYELDDQSVIVELTKLKGVGKWTAEMILIFSLSRPDVFSIGDLGLRNAVAKLYGINRDNLEEIEKLSQNWKPYRSLASHYLWRSLNNKPIVSASPTD